MEGPVIAQLVAVIATGLLTGAVSAIATVAAVRVHISYLRSSVERAHKRIDDIQGVPRHG